MLCTISDIKERLGLAAAETTHDAVIERIILGFTARAERYCGRGLLAPSADVTEYYTGGVQLLQLYRCPIIAITSIKECLGYNFDDADGLNADTDYRLVNPGSDNRGVLARLYGCWFGGYDGIQVIYRGGYEAAGVTPETGKYALPDDLREAAIFQCSFLFKRRDDIGLSGVSFQGGSFNKFDALKLLPEVAHILDSYKRILL